MGYLTVRLTDEQQRDLWRQAAEAEGMSLSSWVRRALTRHAERERLARQAAPRRSIRTNERR